VSREFPRSRSPYLQQCDDNSIPIDPVAVDLMVARRRQSTRWSVRPLLQFIFAILLHITWALKRLPLRQFRAHGLLQRMIAGSAAMR